MESDAIQRQSKRAAHEPSDTSARAIWLAAAGLFALMMVSLLIVGAMINILARTEVQPEVATASQLNPSPPGTVALNANQPAQLRQLRKLESSLLDEYQWIDPSARIARIPIQRAIEIIAAEGLPSSPPDELTTPTPRTGDSASEQRPISSEDNSP